MRLIDMKLIIGSKYTEEINELKALGYETVTFEPSTDLDDEIASHADINAFNCNGEYIILNESIADQIGEVGGDSSHVMCSGIKSPYPDDIKLNGAIIGNKLLCNEKHIADEIIHYAQKRNLEIIHTNQGYSKCSVCVVADNAVITEDDGIAYLLKNYQIKVLKITKGYVYLSDKHCGFIGGASGKLSNTEIYFSGDISSHPDYERIIDFLNNYNVKPVFNRNRRLNDFGGFIKI